jgi:hypothetical protein
LHPVGEIYGGPMLYELGDAATVLKFFRDIIRDAPEGGLNQNISP